MRIAILFLVFLFSSLCFAQTELSPHQDSPEAMAKELGIELPRRPWHMVNLWWSYEAATPNTTNLAIDITIDRDVPDSYNLYISPVGNGQLNGQMFYGGIQSNINGWKTKESRRRVHPGKGAIFSRWSADKKTPIGLDHVRKMPDGLCESAGYEGEFCSVRRPYAWSKGTYTWSLSKGETEQVKGKPETWWICKVKDHASGKTTEIGSLRFAGETFKYWDRHSAFVEVYATSKIPRSGIPACHVTFGMPRVNGKEPPLRRVEVVYPRKRGPVSPPCVTTVEDGRKIRCEVGAIVPRSKMDPDRVLKIK